MTKHHQFPEPERPRKASRLKQLSKSNRLMRRFYSGRTIPAPVIKRPVFVTEEE